MQIVSFNNVGYQAILHQLMQEGEGEGDGANEEGKQHGNSHPVAGALLDPKIGLITVQ